MKAALLCNGPSRVDFTTNADYDYVIGCNIPWTAVDATVILDIEVIRYLNKETVPIPNKIFFSDSSWRETKLKRHLYEDAYLGIVEHKRQESSGHVACKKLIEMGYTVIDVYGCDSYFINNNDSFTHQYVENIPPKVTEQIRRWRNEWDTIIRNNEHITLNFIRKPS